MKGCFSFICLQAFIPWACGVKFRTQNVLVFRMMEHSESLPYTPSFTEVLVQPGQPAASLWSSQVISFPPGHECLASTGQYDRDVDVRLCLWETVCGLESKKDGLGSHWSHVILLRRAEASSTLVILQGKSLSPFLPPPWPFPWHPAHALRTQLTAAQQATTL